MHAHELLLDSSARLEQRISLRLLDCLVEDVVGLREPAGLEQCLNKVGQELRRFTAGEQRARTLEQRDRGRQVSVPESALPCGPEQSTGARTELEIVAASSLRSLKACSR